MEVIYESGVGVSAPIPGGEEKNQQSDMASVSFQKIHINMNTALPALGHWYDQ